MTILGQRTWNVFELRSLLGIVSNDLMSSCTGDANGLDVVLSGFFSSTRIFPNHSFDPDQIELAEAALAHRLIIKTSSSMHDIDPRQVVAELLNSVPVDATVPAPGERREATGLRAQSEAAKRGAAGSPAR